MNDKKDIYSIIEDLCEQLATLIKLISLSLLTRPPHDPLLNVLYEMQEQTLGNLRQAILLLRHDDAKFLEKFDALLNEHRLNVILGTSFVTRPS